ncbi:MAG: PD-(D/E)XK nuclease family protein, partial [Enterobacterales bacterium endosymbiont of Blomia tropicalis]|uniref:PD-(D/E)XK nuclease family protein n=1 Tax=Mixta mediterraneensis TaxID=2758443 RepID=UPI0025A901BF
MRVSGRFADLEYMPGMRIKALACPCCSAPSHNPICSVSDTENIILIEDNIISVTSFCTALDCINNPLFKDIIADISFVYSHKSLAVGRVCHKLIESCISKQRKDLPFLISETKKIIQTYPGYLYCCNITAKELLNELLKLFKPINAFLAQRSDHTLAEYSVISLTFSMKGNIDCLEPGTYRNPGSVIEIKTGTRQSVSHRAQLMIYSLLYAEQRSISCKSLGCALYYAKSGETVFAKITHSEIAGLVQLRNRIAATKSVTSCNCSEGTPCHIYNKIKTLPETHFLRRLLAAIEEERSGGRTYIKAVLLGNANKGIQKGAEDKHSIYSYRYPVRIKDAIPENEYMLVFTRSKQFVTRGTVKHDADGSLNICTKDALPLDKIFFVSIDGSSIFYRYMLWSLFYVLYPMYFGLKTCLFKLPGATCNSDENDDIGMTLSSINSEEMSDIESGWLES